MALEGTLRDFSLADIFQLIGIQKKTGILSLKDGREVVTVSFLNGNVVSADSQNRKLEDRLGNVLVKSRRVTDDQLQRALKVQKETLQRLGHILVEMGFISEADLRDALRLQVTQIVYRLFRWKDGDYHFSQETTVEYDKDHFTPLSAENILMEGIRMIDEWPIIERKIKSFKMIFRKARPHDAVTILSEEEEEAGDGAFDAALGGEERSEEAQEPEGIRLGREEALIYELIDGRLTVQELIDRGRMGDFETCRILYDLISRSLIASADKPFVPQAPVRKRPSMAPMLEKAGYLALGLVATVSILTMPASPLSGLPDRTASSEAIDQVKELVTRNRVERLDEAIQVYYLQKGFYPDDLKDLVKGKLVAAEGLVDPWGRGFGFVSSPQGYRIMAYDLGGAEVPHRSLVRLKLQPEASPEPTPASSAAQLSGERDVSRSP